MASLTINSKQRMNSGYEIPTLGYGAYQVPADICGDVVTQALQAGYRHIDSAAMYRNEIPAGQAILSSNIPRSSVFFTSKVYQPSLTYEGVKAQVSTSLQNCGLKYIDLMLIHAPYGGRSGRKGAWKALVESVSEGKVRSIGVSNYGVQHLDEMEEYMKELEEEGGKGMGGVLSVGQWEIHPWLPRKDIVEWCRTRNIIIQAYSPLVRSQKLDSPALQPLIEKHHKSAAQILIRWSLQHGYVPLPKSVTSTRIVENAAVYDFELSEEDMQRLDLDGYFVSGWDPTVAGLDR
ncbi:hypothetical protein WAI453_009755 [Rhynchosporium graminicola]